MAHEFGKINDVVTAKFRIVTPMFIGGDEHKADELRPASIKGMLRFWWRALNWSKFREVNGADDASALRALHDEEARLFGSAAGENCGGQGCFLMSLLDMSKPFVWAKVTNLQTAYLLGMGLYHFRNGLTRQSRDGDFQIALRFRVSATQLQRSSVIQAVMILGLLGGLGSRSRRGLGSIALKEIQGVERQKIPSSLAEYQSEIAALFSHLSATQPPYTAFSAQCRTAYLHHTSAMEALTAAGNELGMYRSYGREGKAFGKVAERNFKQDHDEMYAAANRQNFERVPQRLIFGMPHNYRFSSGGNVAIQQSRSGLQRRGSPLFIHVHELPNNQFVSLFLLMPAQFLPHNDAIKIANKFLPVSVDWQVIQKLMERPVFVSGSKA